MLVLVRGVAGLGLWVGGQCRLSAGFEKPLLCSSLSDGQEVGNGVRWAFGGQDARAALPVFALIVAESGLVYRPGKSGTGLVLFYQRQ